jgi:hypothetical protein
LAEKLRAARSEQEKLEDNYRAELRAQTKLVDLYRQGWKKPGFLKKTSPVGFFWVFWGFWGVLGFFIYWPGKESF